MQKIIASIFLVLMMVNTSIAAVDFSSEFDMGEDFWEVSKDALGQDKQPSADTSSTSTKSAFKLQESSNSEYTQERAAPTLELPAPPALKKSKADDDKQEYGSSTAPTLSLPDISSLPSIQPKIPNEKSQADVQIIPTPGASLPITPPTKQLIDERISTNGNLTTTKESQGPIVSSNHNDVSQLTSSTSNNLSLQDEVTPKEAKPAIKPIPGVISAKKAASSSNPPKDSSSGEIKPQQPVPYVQIEEKQTNAKNTNAEETTATPDSIQSVIKQKAQPNDVTKKSIDKAPAKNIPTRDVPESNEKKTSSSKNKKAKAVKTTNIARKNPIDKTNEGEIPSFALPLPRTKLTPDSNGAANKVLTITPRKIYDFRTQILPPNISKKQYSPQNQHLPKVFFQQEYTELLFIAAAKDDIGGIKVLLSRGANINAQDSKNGYTPLMYAIANGNTRATRYLITKGADIHKAAYDGSTVLHVAASANNNELIKILLLAGADPMATDHSGRKPYSNVSQNKEEIAIQFASYYDNMDEALVSCAAMDILICVKYALARGANVNARDRNGDTALILATYNRSISILNFLIAKGADLNSKNKQGYSALDSAYNLGYDDITALLETAKIQDEIKGYDLVPLIEDIESSEIPSVITQINDPIIKSGTSTVHDTVSSSYIDRTTVRDLDKEYLQHKSQHHKDASSIIYSTGIDNKPKQIYKRITHKN